MRPKRRQSAMQSDVRMVAFRRYMGPKTTRKNAADMPPRYAEALGYLPMRRTRIAHAAHFNDIGFMETSVTIKCTYRASWQNAPALSCHVVAILLRRSEKQMVRAHTWWVIAPV